ncbi:GNAT family N-acetyltransferase [Chloroflexota bacterium]
MDSTPEVSIRPVRRDGIGDAAGVAAVLNSIIAERTHTALAGHWTPEEELAFLQGLGPRSELFVAVQLQDRPFGLAQDRPQAVAKQLHKVGERIVGFQVIEPFVTYTSTMDHVCQLGTYVHADFRGRRIGQRLAQATLEYACSQGYEKSVVYVLACNSAARAYYQGMGFEESGTLTRQTKIDGVYYDEVLLELNFRTGG